MALLLPPVLLGLVLWLGPTVVVLLVLAVARALDYVRQRAEPSARRRERAAMGSGLRAP